MAAEKNEGKKGGGFRLREGELVPSVDIFSYEAFLNP